MFNIVEKNQKLVKGILIAITATFVLWGIGGYLNMAGDDGYIAKVGSDKIYPKDIDQAMQEQGQKSQDKVQVLFGLINRQLLINNINQYHMVATKEQLQKEISSIPAFQESGSFNLALYQRFLSDNFMTAEQFQHNVQQQILINQFVNFFNGSYSSSSLFDKKFAELLSRERNVSTYAIDPQQFYPQIKISEAQISQTYKQNIAKFTIPEQAQVQYITLNSNTAEQNIKLTDDEINKYIASHQAEVSNKQIDVSHILFAVPEGATESQRAAIKAQAEKVLAMAKANPSQFAALAKKYSQDSGSAQNGGDLGYFGQGVMVKPFNDVAFKLKPNQISDLVETQFGYHIIKSNAIKGGDNPADIREMAIGQLKKQKLAKVLQDELTQLNEITYNQASSLAPAAQKLGLTIESSDWISKGTLTGDFANPKIQKAIFSDDAIKNHNNTEVVDLGNSTYVVYHVIAAKPQQIKTLDQVKDQITQELKLQQASSMATQLGQQQISQIQSGSLKLNFSNPQDVSLLAQNDSIDSMAVKQIFATPLTKTPAYTGSINKSGQFIIYQINSEKIDPKLDQQNKAVLKQLENSDSMLDLDAYMSYLRTKFNVTYKIDRLNLQSQ